MSTPALSLRNLTLDLPTPAGPVRILHGVDLEVGRGEIVGLVGESGSGKSLTALSVLGLLPRGAEVGGTVELDGTDLLEAPARVLRTVRGGRVGMVFQDPMTTLDPVMRVGRQIGEAYRIHHRDAGRREVRRRTFELLELVGVPDAAQRARQYPHQWSGGMRQRAVIAMALANDPDVIIADEPTTALDATIQAQVLDVLALAQRETGVAVVLITHDLGLVAQMADRVVVMYAGRVVESATTEELFGESRHPYTAALMASRPAAHRRGEQLHVIEGRPPNMADLPRGCPFEPRCASPLREDRCRSEVPALQASSDGRWSACHFREHGLPARQMEVR